MTKISKIDIAHRNVIKYCIFVLTNMNNSQLHIGVLTTILNEHFD
jgi:hypothetical protein